MADRASQEAINALRRPKIIYSQDFLNDPIQFESDERFDAESALKFADPDIPIADRDEAEFVVVDLNAETAQYYSANLYRTDVNRDDFEKVIAKKRRLTELLLAENN